MIAPVQGLPGRLGSGGSQSLVVVFVVLQFLLQFSLLFDAVGPARTYVRGAAFAASLILLVTVPGRGPVHPSSTAAAIALVIVGASVAHPNANTLLASTAQAAMYLAIIAPLFWISRARPDVPTLRRLITIMWAYHAVSSALGVLQVYYPGQFQPNVSTAILGQRDYIEGLKIILDDGTSVLRPMGLTDIPGGAAVSGLYTVLFGIGFLLGSNSPTVRFAAGSSLVGGFACLYLCQVRSVLVMTLFCIIAICIALALRREYARLSLLACLTFGIVIGSFVWAVSVGGRSVATRLESLMAEDPSQVYYRNRGVFFQHTVEELLPRYPLGAGLGRWGMMHSYFGDNSNPDTGMIWVEIQWTGWVVDGGFPLVLAYTSALVIAGLAAWRISLDKEAATRGDLWLWAIVVLAYDIGVCANTFNYAWFAGQGGLEFWLLNATLYAAYRRSRESAEGIGDFGAVRASRGSSPAVWRA